MKRTEKSGIFITKSEPNRKIQKKPRSQNPNYYFIYNLDFWSFYRTEPNFKEKNPIFSEPYIIFQVCSIRLSGSFARLYSQPLHIEAKLSQLGKNITNLTRNEPTRSKIMLQKKNEHLQSHKKSQTDTPSLVRLDSHEIMWTAEYV